MSKIKKFVSERCIMLAAIDVDKIIGALKDRDALRAKGH